MAVWNDSYYSYLAFEQSCIYISTNSGVTWVRSDSPAMLGWSGVAYSSDGSHVVAVGRDVIYVLQSPAPDPPLPPSPRLNIECTGSNIGLSWLVPSTPFVLQETTDLGAPNWTDVPACPELDFTSLHRRVKLTPSANGSFYRLKQQ
ncbi:MAG: hypothetical protein NT154_22760 [Verrucomicrobia bacterium]|nr:hypothetical protein [Verrucomicrobiota bacterium]